MEFRWLLLLGYLWQAFAFRWKFLNGAREVCGFCNFKVREQVFKNLSTLEVCIQIDFDKLNGNPRIHNLFSFIFI